MSNHILHRAAFLVGGGGGSFSPGDVAGLSLWLHAPYEGGNEPAALSAYAQNPSLTTGDAIQTATDWSGTGHPTQATLTKRPTWNTGLVGGKSAFTLDGSNDSWLVSFGGGVKLWIAGVVTSGAGALGFLLHWGVVFNFQQWELVHTTAGASNTIGRRGTSGSKINMGGSWGAGVSTDRVNFNISDTLLEMAGTKSDVDILTGAASGPATIPLGGATQNLEIGARSGGSAFSGNIASLLVFTTVPSLDDQLLINAWLDNEFSL